MASSATPMDMRYKTTGCGRCALATTMPLDPAIGSFSPPVQAMRLTASSGSLRLRTIALRRSNRPEWPVAGRARRSKQQSWLTNSGCRCEDWGELECIQLHLRGTHWRLGPEPVLRSELHRCRHGAIEKCPPQRTLPDANPLRVLQSIQSPAVSSAG